MKHLQSFFIRAGFLALAVCIAAPGFAGDPVNKPKTCKERGKALRQAEKEQNLEAVQVLTQAIALDPCCQKNYECTNVSRNDGTQQTIVSMGAGADPAFVEMEYTPVRFIRKKKMEEKDQSLLKDKPQGTLVREIYLVTEEENETGKTQKFIQTVCQNTVASYEKDGDAAGGEVTKIEIPNNKKDRSAAYVFRKSGNDEVLYSLRKDKIKPTAGVTYAPVEGSNDVLANFYCASADVGVLKLAEEARSLHLVNGGNEEYSVITAMALDKWGRFRAWVDGHEIPGIVQDSAGEYIVNSSLRSHNDILAIVGGGQQYWVIFGNGGADKGEMITGWRQMGGTVRSYAKRFFPRHQFTSP